MTAVGIIGPHFQSRLFFFVCNFNMTLEASGTLKADMKVQYLRTLICGKALSHFDAFSDEV